MGCVLRVHCVCVAGVADPRVRRALPAIYVSGSQTAQSLPRVPLPRLTPLQVRYIAKSAVAQAEGGWIPRVFRSDYYDRAEHSERTWMWLIDTRLHGHFNQLDRKLEEDQQMSDQYSDLGRIVSLQIVTSPAHVADNFARWWRLSFPIGSTVTDERGGSRAGVGRRVPDADGSTFR